MRYAWTEAKRRRHLKDHGLDFVDAQAVFAGLTFTFVPAWRAVRVEPVTALRDG